jgi:hypothetical protein
MAQSAYFTKSIHARTVVPGPRLASPQASAEPGIQSTDLCWFGANKREAARFNAKSNIAALDSGPGFAVPERRPVAKTSQICPHTQRQD